MKSRIGLTTALACLALVTGAGCGGGDDDDGGGASGDEPLTASEYREQGNALCKDAIREVEAIPAPKAPPEIAGYLEKVFDSTENVTDEFVKLDPPDELRADHDKAVELSRESEAKFDGIVERVRGAEDPSAAVLTEFRKLGPELKRSEELNEKLGLDECNEVGQPAQQPDAS